MNAFAENPAQALRQLGVTLPLKLSGQEVGEVLDVNGVRVLAVDPDGILPNEAADGVAAFVVLTVNAAVSFRAFGLLTGEDDPPAADGGQG